MTVLATQNDCFCPTPHSQSGHFTFMVRNGGNFYDEAFPTTNRKVTIAEYSKRTTNSPLKYFPLLTTLHVKQALKKGYRKCRKIAPTRNQDVFSPVIAKITRTKQHKTK